MRTLFLLLAGLLIAPALQAGTDSSPRWSDARQLVLVTIPHWDSQEGMLRAFERTGAGWRPARAATQVSIGRAGAAWGIGLHEPQPGPRKREGDGRSPAGVFALGTAFGYATSARTGLPYTAMHAAHWCIDVADSPLYNRIVDAREVGAEAVAGSTEPMRLDLHAAGDQRYQLGFVIEHNAAGEAGAGSCIFAHLWGKPGQPTAGCTAMAQRAMRELLAWLDASRRPVFVLLPEGEYERLQGKWSLPPLPPRSPAPRP